ncbi:hypothetical protein ACJX0J_015016, partial [Zea mays]
MILGQRWLILEDDEGNRIEEEVIKDDLLAFLNFGVINLLPKSIDLFAYLMLEKIDKLVVPTTGFANESCGYRAFLLCFEQPTHFHDTNKIGGLGVANLAIKNNGKWQEILKNKYFGSKSLTQIQGE